MDSRHWRTRLALLAWALLFAIGCAAEAAGVDDAVDDEAAALRPAAQALSFTELVDPEGIGTAGEQKTRLLIAAGRRYERVFGHAAPADVDFSAGDAVIFYSAGVRRTGGYDASIARVVLRGTMLHVVTALESPGEHCIVTQALSKPHVLVKVRLPSVVQRVRFHSRNTVRDCSEPPPFCGGIAGFPCPDGQECVDDPSDDCDPANGGADCGGMCVPAIDPCATVRCGAGTHCAVNADGQAECVPDPTIDPCATVRCRAGSRCEVNAAGQAQCVRSGPFCGGIASFPCPGVGECIDDPTDDCDPNAGGADCGGVCICARTESCPRGQEFDTSPEVCDCAGTPVITPCATVLCPQGTRCEVQRSGEPACLSDGSQACGRSTCAAGSVCCNASCGVCTPPGTFCTQQACL
jgi:hypothetical protein